MDARPRAQEGTATVLPLLGLIIALALVVLVLGMLAIGHGRPASSSAPPWSGNQAPPGVVTSPVSAARPSGDR